MHWLLIVLTIGGASLAFGPLGFFGSIIGVILWEKL